MPNKYDFVVRFQFRIWGCNIKRAWTINEQNQWTVELPVFCSLPFRLQKQWSLFRMVFMLLLIGRNLNLHNSTARIPRQRHWTEEPPKGHIKTKSKENCWKNNKKDFFKKKELSRRSPFSVEKHAFRHGLTKRINNTCKFQQLSACRSSVFLFCVCLWLFLGNSRSLCVDLFVISLQEPYVADLLSNKKDPTLLQWKPQ